MTKSYIFKFASHRQYECIIHIDIGISVLGSGLHIYKIINGIQWYVPIGTHPRFMISQSIVFQTYKCLTTTINIKIASKLGYIFHWIDSISLFIIQHKISTVSFVLHNIVSQVYINKYCLVRLNHIGLQLTRWLSQSQCHIGSIFKVRTTVTLHALAGSY